MARHCFSLFGLSLALVLPACGDSSEGAGGPCPSDATVSAILGGEFVAQDHHEGMKEGAYICEWETADDRMAKIERFPPPKEPDLTGDRDFESAQRSTEDVEGLGEEAFAALPRGKDAGKFTKIYVLKGQTKFMVYADAPLEPTKKLAREYLNDHGG
jgi:hypothetical protein